MASESPNPPTESQPFVLSRSEHRGRRRSWNPFLVVGVTFGLVLLAGSVTAWAYLAVRKPVAGAESLVRYIPGDAVEAYGFDGESLRQLDSQSLDRPLHRDCEPLAELDRGGIARDKLSDLVFWRYGNGSIGAAVRFRSAPDSAIYLRSERLRSGVSASRSISGRFRYGRFVDARTLILGQTEDIAAGSTKTSTSSAGTTRTLERFIRTARTGVWRAIVVDASNVEGSEFSRTPPYRKLTGAIVSLSVRSSGSNAFAELEFEDGDRAWEAKSKFAWSVSERMRMINRWTQANRRPSEDSEGESNGRDDSDPPAIRTAGKTLRTEISFERGPTISVLRLLDP